MARPGRAKAPGSPVRVAISPSKGARRMQSFTSREEPSSLACVASRFASSLVLCASFCSASFAETKPPSRSPWTRADSFATACCLASSARACIATAWLVALAPRQSSVASTSPFLTIAPGRTSTVST